MVDTRAPARPRPAAPSAAPSGGGTALRQGVQSASVGAAALLAVLIAAGHLGVLVEGSSWWWTAALVSVVAIGAAALVRLRWRNPVLPTAVSTVIAAVGVLLIYVPQSLAFGIVPTAATVDDLRFLVSVAFEHIQSEAIPASPNTGVDLLLVTGIVVIAILVDGLAVSARLPAVAALPVIALTVAPGRAAAVGIDFAGISLAIAALLLMLWLDRGRGFNRPPVLAAGGIAALAIVAGLLGQAVAPAFNDDIPVRATIRPVFATGAEPLVRLGDHLRRGTEVVALTYSTTSTAPVYLRVVTIDDLSGEDWYTRPLEETADGERPISAFPPVPGLADDVARETVVTTVSDEFAERRWLPLPYPAVAIDELEGSERWAWDPDSLAAGTRDDSEPVGDYRITSLDVQPTVEQLRASSGDIPSDFERYLELPASRPDAIGSTAAQVVEGAETQYDAAVAIQNYLRSPDFLYDEDTPEEADGDGDSFDVIATFLDEKRGYCVHFASAMTVMAREIGIPARIAVGYQPGQRQANGGQLFEVTSYDLHAWPELYFAGIGWTRFEPTPGRGDVPSYAAAPDTTATPTASSAPVPAPSATTTQRDDAAVRGDDTTTGPAVGSLWGVFIPLAVAAVLATPGLWRAALRRRRLGSLYDGDVSAGWDELHETVIDLGVAGAPRSPRMLGDDIARVLDLDANDREALTRWRESVERVRFSRRGDASPGDHPVDTDFAQGLLGRLRRSASIARRIGAAVAPWSLLARSPVAKKAVDAG